MKIEKIGFTGTRLGMTAGQKEALTNLLQELKPSEFHHGDCIGADQEACEMAQTLQIPTICHPPVKKDLQAHTTNTHTRQPKPYLERNRNIVEETHLLIAAPHLTEPSKGTNYTINYAKSLGKTVLVL